MAKPPLLEAIANAGYWYKGGIDQYEMTTKLTSNEYLSYSEEEFDAVDQRLWRVLETLEASASTVWGPVLASNLVLWAGKMLEMPIAGPTAQTYLVDKILSFTQNELSDTVTVDATTCLVGTTASGINYVSDIDRRDLVVPAAWMDQQFPDWRGRYAVARALDLDNKALVAHVTQVATMLPPVSIENVTFED